MQDINKNVEETTSKTDEVLDAATSGRYSRAQRRSHHEGTRHGKSYRPSEGGVHNRAGFAVFVPWNNGTYRAVPLLLDDYFVVEVS